MTMRNQKKKRLESKGWKVGTPAEFLDLTPEESAYIELKLILSKTLREKRQKSALTQVELAHLIESSQSRVAKMEAGDPSVTLDLLIHSLLALGATRLDLARVIAQASGASAA